VFVVLYAVLRGLTRRTSPLGFNVGFVGGQLSKGASHLAIPPTPVVPASGPHCATPAATPGACFDPSYLKHSTTLYTNLSHTNVMQAMGMNLAESASTAVKSGVVHALPYIVLIAIVGVTGWVQQKQIQGRTPASQMPQQQQTLMKVMPFFLPVISIGLPAALVLYFAVSNIYRVGQQWFISRSMYGPSTAAADGAKGSGGDGGKGPGGGKSPAGPSGGNGAAKAAVAKSSTKVTKAASSGDTTGRRTKAPPRDKAPTSASSGGGGSGRTRGRTTEPKASTNSDDRATRATKASKGASSTKPNGAGGSDTPPAKPVLQPRARKNKKG
jgi:YidC/Oxa1 family membrane protein insertase